MHIPGLTGLPAVPPVPSSQPEVVAPAPALPVDTARVSGWPEPEPVRARPENREHVVPGKWVEQRPAPPTTLHQEEAPGDLDREHVPPLEWRQGILISERREILPKVFELGRRLEELSEQEAAPLVAWSNSSDPLVARAANFALGRPLNDNEKDPLARLYLPFRPGDEGASLARDKPLHEFLQGLEIRPDMFGRQELPDTQGRMVSVSRALVDRLVHDPDSNSERTALSRRRNISAWDGLEQLYSLIQPEPELVNDLFERVEQAYRESGHSQAMAREDRTRLSVLASLSLNETDRGRFARLLEKERFQERNWLGDVVDELVRVPQQQALADALADPDLSMQSRLARGRELFGLTINMGESTSSGETETIERLTQALSSLSPHALQSHAGQLVNGVRARLPGLGDPKRLATTDDLTPLYELSALLRCPGVDQPAAELLNELEATRQSVWSGRITRALSQLELGCVEHEAGRLAAQSLPEQRANVERCLRAAASSPLKDEMARAALTKWQAACSLDPQAAGLLASLPPPEEMGPEKTAQVVEALFCGLHGDQERALAPPALALLLRRDAPGAQICGEYVVRDLAPALLEKEVQALISSHTPSERARHLSLAFRLADAGEQDFPAVGKAFAQSATPFETKLLEALGLALTARVYPVLTGASTDAEAGLQSILACRSRKASLEDSLEAYELTGGRDMDDYLYLLDLMGPKDVGQAIGLLRQWKELEASGLEPEAARRQVLGGLTGAPEQPSAGVQEQAGAVQIGGVRVRKRA